MAVAVMGLDRMWGVLPSCPEVEVLGDGCPAMKKEQELGEAPKQPGGHRPSPGSCPGDTPSSCGPDWEPPAPTAAPLPCPRAEGPQGTALLVQGGDVPLSGPGPGTDAPSALTRPPLLPHRTPLTT